MKQRMTHAELLHSCFDTLKRWGGTSLGELYFGAASVADEILFCRDILELDSIDDDTDVADGLEEWASRNMDDDGSVIA